MTTESEGVQCCGKSSTYLLSNTRATFCTSSCSYKAVEANVADPPPPVGVEGRSPEVEPIEASSAVWSVLWLRPRPEEEGRPPLAPAPAVEADGMLVPPPVEVWKRKDGGGTAKFGKASGGAPTAQTSAMVMRTPTRLRQVSPDSIIPKTPHTNECSRNASNCALNELSTVSTKERKARCAGEQGAEEFEEEAMRPKELDDDGVEVAVAALCPPPLPLPLLWWKKASSFANTLKGSNGFAAAEDEDVDASGAVAETVLIPDAARLDPTVPAPPPSCRA